MSTIQLIFVVIIFVVIVLIIGTLFLLPGMAIFNKMTDKAYHADEKDLLTGTLTVGIASRTATGEVMTTFVTESRKTMPARLFIPNKAGIETLEKGASVLIVETKDGIAYVIPYEEMVF
ncbi:hypothetical protein GHI93_08600 [Lactococcus hircilactis]|uniref:DUF1449 family protein n=1 Tax=Lactococcus hircilactis TaxID=1494462 RepID=A0A7X2D2E3_9LACT|nr:hypothetical protein [Lactococcus hircilactis]MQW39985.1 hypothetical protein [Lactococcus hircilactis]